MIMYVHMYIITHAYIHMYKVKGSGLLYITL